MTSRMAFKALAALFCGLCWSWGAVAADPAGKAACPALLQQNLLRLQDEKPQSLCQYSGKVLLVVNTASYCGFTPQYKDLEALHAKYAGKGLVVLGFPSNDFAQEKASNKEIADFCENTFGVKFPMFTKTVVTGADASPFYKQLASATGKNQVGIFQVPDWSRWQGGGHLWQHDQSQQPQRDQRN